MQKINIVIAVLALIVLSACSGGMNTDFAADNAKTSSDISVVTLADVWNANAVANNFQFADPDMTLGQLYKGTDFDTDMDRMEEIIALELGLNREDVNGTSTMGFVHFDDETVD